MGRNVRNEVNSSPLSEITLLAWLILSLTVSCANSSISSMRTADPDPPLPAGIVSTTANPLVAQYSISPPDHANVRVEFGPTTSYGFETSPQATPQGGGPVNILVAGMRQNSLYHMRAIVDYASEPEDFDSDHTFTTGAVLPPNQVPQLTLQAGATPTTPGGPAPAAGIEMVSLTGNGNALTAEALDPSGNLIWYYAPTDVAPVMMKIMPNGYLVMIAGSANLTLIREIDLAGNTIRQLTVNDLNNKLNVAGYPLVLALHHDIVPLANGHLLVLVNGPKIFTDLPGYPGQTTVIGDQIIDLDSNYNIAWVWSTFDHLDVNRHPMAFPDWTHSNCIYYSQDDGNLLLSMRHQHWVIKIDYQDGRGSGDILWRLGYQGDFALESGAPANWFYAQHYATVVSPNTTGDFELALFDNGDNRVLNANGTTCGSSGAAACYSRPAIFEVNEATKVARLVWAYNTVYSFWGGAAQLLPNSHVFFDITAPGDNPTGARVMEMTQAQTPEVVWRLDVNGQNSYRTIHLPSLYPGVQW